MILVDTSAVFALLNADDPRHTEAREVWEALRSEQQDLVITNYAITETMSLVSRRLGMDAARFAHRLMTSLTTTLWTNEFEHHAAMRHFLRSGRSMSFVDCATFATMRARGLNDAFAFDEDFSRAGFRLVTP